MVNGMNTVQIAVNTFPKENGVSRGTVRIAHIVGQKWKGEHIWTQKIALYIANNVC